MNQMRAIKKTVFVLLFSSSIVFWGHAQQGGPGPIDLILVLDTSSSMSASYSEVNNYITGPFLKEFLRIGDTFHLISFSDKPRLEIARRVAGQGELETIIGRMLLMYPLDPFSDIPGALAYVEKYSDGLPSSRPKKIVLISDGDASPAPDGSAPLDPAGLQTLISDIKSRLNSRGISLDHVTVPLGRLPVSGRPPYTPPLGVPVRVARTPEPVQPAPGSADGVTPSPVQPAAPEVTPLSSPGADGGIDGGVTVQPAAPGVTLPAKPAGDDVNIPEKLSLPVIGFSLLGLAFIGGIIFLATRRRRDASDGEERKINKPLPKQAPKPQAPESPAPSPQAAKPVAVPPTQAARPITASPTQAARPVAAPPTQAARPVTALPSKLSAPVLLPVAKPVVIPSSKTPAPPVPSRRLTPYVDLSKPTVVPDDGRPLMLKLFVENQNTLIGMRNVHLVKQGFKFTIGGGKSDFLVFLSPLPPHIAELHYEDRHVILVPLKSRYFPDIGSDSVKDCIGRTIRIISDKDYELFMRIEWYEDPVIKLNALLRSVNVPG